MMTLKNKTYNEKMEIINEAKKKYRDNPTILGRILKSEKLIKESASN